MKQKRIKKDGNSPIMATIGLAIMAAIIGALVITVIIQFALIYFLLQKQDLMGL